MSTADTDPCIEDIVFFVIFRDEPSSNVSNAGGAGAASSSSDPSKKFEFLLKQTELFSHFMGETKAKSPLKVKEKAKGKGMYTN